MDRQHHLIGGFKPCAGMAVYSAARAGMLVLARLMAVEVAPYGINVNCVAPGSALTQDGQEQFQDQNHATTYCPRELSTDLAN
jgi:NAD(P)-dependent dehydrogenase (short-subunit alcohol dehydrogenase family)